MGVGGRVAETIRKKIVDPALFADDPAILMLGMTSALVGSSIYMTFATKLGMPVSTTHSTMGGVIGMAIATVGAENLDWGWNGISQVFAAWAIAPALAGAFGAVIFSITKYGVMMRKNPVKAALVSVPFYFALTTGLLVSEYILDFPLNFATWTRLSRLTCVQCSSSGRELPLVWTQAML